MVGRFLTLGLELDAGLEIAFYNHTRLLQLLACSLEEEEGERLTLFDEDFPFEDEAFGPSESSSEDPKSSL